MIAAGLGAAAIWYSSAVLGFQQFGMTTVLVGVAVRLLGIGAVRVAAVQRSAAPGIARRGQYPAHQAHRRDAAGARPRRRRLPARGDQSPDQGSALVSILEDIFVAVAILSISVGLVLPGILAHAMVQVSDAATAMSKGAMANFSNALLALGRGDLDAAHARVDVVRVQVRSGDEVGAMAASINLLQEDIARAAASLDRAREELRVARHDALTGLITRREFERRLDAALAKTHTGQRWYALLYLDLDHFKIVNDTCGHAAGDELLRQITGVLRAAVRNRDSVARLGGDEFAMLLDDCPPQSAERIAQDLLQCDPGIQFRFGRKHLQDWCQHRPRHVPRRQPRVARADARGGRRLLRREEEGAQSRPGLPARGY